MKFRCEHYKLKPFTNWDYLDFGLAFDPRIYENKFNGFHLHIQLLCRCWDFSVTIRKDIDE